MPWASQAQRAYFHAHPELHKYIAEFDAATPKGARLPRHVGRKEPRMASNFDRLAAKLSKRPGVSSPRGLAAVIGRRRYGSKVMSKAAAQGVSARSVAKRRG